jgi:F-type H+-transporting ATPase subunit b
MATETQESVGQPEAVHKPALLQFDPGIGIWTLVAFVLLMILLRRFAWKPILQSIDERDEKIKHALSRAEQIQHESEKNVEEQKKVLATAQEHAAKILSDSRRNAEVIKDQLIEAAHKEKTKIIRSATDEIEALRIQIKTELREFSADLAVNTAEKILMDQLDKDKAKNLASRMVKEFQP